MTVLIQPSFAAGELSPSVYGRVDIAKYSIGLRTAKNVFIRPHGGVSNRAGLEFIGPVKDHSGIVRLIPFSFNTEQNYVLEFGETYMRVLKDGGHVLETAKAVSGVTQADPVVVTTATHSYSNGDEVFISDVVGMTQLNGNRYTIANITATTFELTDQVTGVDIDGTGFTAYSSGGESKRVFTLTSPYAASDLAKLKFVQSADLMTITHRSYDIRELTRTGHSSWSFSIPTLTDSPFSSPDDLPGTVSYYEQRRVFGSTTNGPDTSWYSKTGDANDFSISIPLIDDDAITATLNSRQVNEIRHFIPLNDLIILTSGSEWRVNSGSDSGFSPLTLRQKPQTTWGVNDMPPITVGSVVLYAHEAGSQVRSLGYALETDAYTGTDLTIIANHLFTNMLTLKEWAYSQIPDSIIWVVRSDGKVRSLTYNQEQKVVAWARHETLGDFESLSTIRESADNEDSVYFVVKRKVNGNTVRYIERMHTRTFNSVQDCFFVDSGLSLDVPVTITGATQADPLVITAASHGFLDGDLVDISDIEQGITSAGTATNMTELNGFRFKVADESTNTFSLAKQTAIASPISGATQANPVVITSVGHGLTDGNVMAVYDVAGMVELNGLSYTVANKTDDTFELTGINGTGFTTYTSGGKIHNSIDGTTNTAYVEGGKVRKAVATISGLDHLEGETVTALADGNVVSNLVVSGGSIALTRAASRVHVGLSYQSDVELLDVESPGGTETIQGKKKKISNVTIRFERSRGLFVGPNEGDLIEMKQREFEVMGAPTELLTGDKRIVFNSEWNTKGRVFMRQTNPLPMSILAVMPDLIVGS